MDTTKFYAYDSCFMHDQSDMISHVRLRVTPGSSVHGISQARILEWTAISSSTESYWPRDWTLDSWVSCIGRWFFTTTTWEALMHAKVCSSCLTFCHPIDCSRPNSSSVGFSRQEYWSGLPFLSPGDLPHPGIKPTCPALQANSLPTEPPGKPYPQSVWWIQRKRSANQGTESFTKRWDLGHPCTIMFGFSRRFK